MKKKNKGVLESVSGSFPGVIIQSNGVIRLQPVKKKKRPVK